MFGWFYSPSFNDGVVMWALIVSLLFLQRLDWWCIIASVHQVLRILAAILFHAFYAGPIIAIYQTIFEL